jgi:hypothetical protein
MKSIIVIGAILLCVALYLAVALDVYKKSKENIKAIHSVWLVVICIIPILGPVLYLSLNKECK